MTSTPAPEVATINHVGLTVTHLETSKRWYSDLLGFRIASEVDQDGYKLAILEREGVAFSIGLFEFPGKADSAFDPYRVGMNHLAFTVPTRDELDTWVARFEELGVRYAPVHESINGWVLTFKDPDDIALEVYTEYGPAGRPPS